MANVGDIVFIGYNGIGNPEGFAFVVMNALPGNDIIKFTDNAINSAAANAFRTTEYAIQWNVPAAGVAAGTVVAIANWGSTSTISFNDGLGGSITSAATVGTLTVGIENQNIGGFNNSGDQIFAYTGTLTSPTILAGLDASSSPIATGTPDSLTTYAPPPGVPFTNLPNGVNAKTIFTSNPGAQSITNLTNPANFSTNTTVFTFTDITPFVVSTPTVTIAATDANAAEAGLDPGTFRITRTGNTTNTLAVSYTIAGQAINGIDYNPNLTGSVTIPAGQSFVDLTITPVDDALVEMNETVALTLLPSGAYNLGANTSATVTIADNDQVAQPDLSTGITTPGPLTVGTPFNYTLDVQNNGTANASGIVLNFTLPANVTYNGVNNVGGGFINPTISGSTLTFTGGSINAGSFAQINVNVTPTQAGVLGGTTLVADPNNSIAESNEANNSVTTNTFTVNAAPGVTINQTDGSTNVTEGGATDTYSVVLNTQPTADVTIAINSGNQTTTNPTNLTFNTANWNVAQTVTVTAVDDAVVEGNHTGTITHTATSNDTKYNNITIASITANITDNDSNNTAPTITENSATPFLNLAATGTGYVSGAIDDPTDPAKTLGIDFTVADTETPNPTVSILSSSNTAVVPLANLNLTNTGNNYNLKINPASVGYSDITVRVTDGGGATADYVIKYAASAASVNPTTTRFLTGASDASTAVAIDSNYMLVADDEDQKIRLYDRKNSGLPLKSFDFTSSLGLTDISGSIPREVDIEASTRVGNRIYWLGSLSNSSNGDPRPNRDRLFATDISGTGANTTLNYVGRYDNLRNDLIAWGNANGYGFSNSAATGVNPEASDGSGFNIEGLTIAPNGTTAYVAFRAPNVPTLSRQKALIAPITNFTDLVTGAATNATIAAPIELNLGGRGIREIQRTANNQYLIIAGPPDAATGTAPKDFRLYTWTGNANDTPILNSADLTSLNAGGSFESILELSSNPSSAAFLGQTTFNTSFIPPGAAGTVNGQQVALGGLSGVTYDAINNRYYAISDDRSNFAPARFYTFTTDPSTIATTGVNFTNVTPLKNPNGNFFALNTVDTEGIAFTSNGTVFISSEGEANPNVGRVTNPFIKEFNLATGVEVRSLPVPAKFLPVVEDTNNSGLIDAGDTQTSGVRDNLSLESLTISPDRTKLYTATESALLQDGPTATTAAGSRNRIVQYDLSSGQPQTEYLYNTDASLGGSIEKGLADLLAIDNQGTLLALERSLVAGGGYTIKIYEVSLQGATDISSINSLSALSPAQLNAIVPAQKRLLLNLNSLNLPADPFHPTGLDNIEGLAFGPQLPDGRRAIVLVSDNNFQQAQYTQILSLAYDPQSTDNRIQLLVDNGDTTFYNDGTIAKDLTQDNWQKFRSEIITLGVPAIAKISEIQGDGATSPLVNTTQTIEGVVVGDFQTPTSANGLGGFFLQEETIDEDGNPLTSEGIFVFADRNILDVSEGQKVRVTGTISETFGQTQITPTNAAAIQVLTGGSLAQVTPATVNLPFASSTFAEQFEGMRVKITQPLTVSDTFELVRFGEITLSNGRLFQPTNIVSPGAAATAQQAANNLNKIILDDGRNGSYQTPFAYGFNSTNPIRTGQTVTNIEGVLSFGFDNYRIQPTVTPTFTGNPRTNAPENVGGTLKVASFNLLNYFNGPNFPTARGASTSAEFTRQRDKTIDAILKMNADIIGLMELENDGYGSDSAIQDLVNGLNSSAAKPNGVTYSFIKPSSSKFDSDEITVGLIYNSAKVTPVGNAAILNTGAFAQGLHRLPLAQTFQDIATGGKFTAVVNHFKSKGSAPAAGDPNADRGDGQGAWNLARTQAANELTAWLATDPTNSGDSDFLIVGDLNSYAKEDPITAIKNNGYTNLIDQFVGQNAYSFNFQGQAGYLDHALSSSNLTSQVTGATEWHINADEHPLIDYNQENLPNGGPAKPADFYNVDPYRSSDHDPVVIGLNLATPNISIQAIDANASEAGNDTGTFRISRSGGGSIGALNVSYTVTGQANSNDYNPSLTGVATIAAGQSFVDVTITPVDDSLVEGNESVIVSLVDAIDYDLSTNNSATITITDNDTAGVTISKSNTNVTEGGATDNYTVVLATQPTAPVTVNVTPSNNQINLGAGAGTAISLNFTPNTWNTPQTVTVTAVDDTQVEGNHTSSISHNATSNDSNYNLNLGNVAVNITDNDTQPNPQPNPQPEPQPEPQPNPTPQPYDCSCEDLEKLVNDSHNGKLPNDNPPNDLIVGSENYELIFGGIGNDSIFGRSGDDLIFGNQDQDFINGNKGNDTIFAGKDNDFVRGGQDNDLIFGDLGNDTLSGDRGNDTVFGGIGDDVLLGFEGDDFLNGNQGKDTVSGGEGNDIVRGGQDDDKLCGNAGNDTLYGDLGNDSICGCEGDDLIFGGAGNDTIAGGAGSDIFVLTSDAGNDVVLDFAIAQDKLALTGGLTFPTLTITQGTGVQANDTLIRIAATGELLASLVGVSASAIGSNLFTTV
ncbi:ExeM/NucH family extracellular endonuclease [Aerosakkonemataceae cyanobacterium BLCC-F50]|uniref:ExeM/NucH family extracellular endonuclease n=1 Tax=Floridaenema flaviceps BLCC-F50 TaxID=3153642 RepID=A0ABV4XS81_9CYAN